MSDRIIGEYCSGLPGRTVVVVGALHGNEPGGVLAIRRVLRDLADAAVTVAGRIIGVVGNAAALAASQRYLSRDLNRIWADPPTADAEALELVTLTRLFDEIIAAALGPVVFVDLHTSSGEGAAFSIITDLARNRQVALTLGLPTVFGLAERTPGAMLPTFVRRGHIGVAIEGGQHRDPATVDILEAAVWRCLVQVGAVAHYQVPHGDTQAERIAAAADGLPRAVRIHHRHLTGENDEFEMAPGWKHFAAVRRGDLLATDRTGEIRAPEPCYLMMPRYEGRSDDGFLLARPMSRLELWSSAAVQWSRQLMSRATFMWDSTAR